MDDGSYRPLITASDSSFTAPVTLQLYGAYNSGGGGGMFDDFVIRA
jgi:hypothetical protein